VAEQKIRHSLGKINGFETGLSSFRGVGTLGKVDEIWREKYETACNTALALMVSIKSALIWHFRNKFTQLDSPMSLMTRLDTRCGVAGGNGLAWSGSCRTGGWKSHYHLKTCVYRKNILVHPGTNSGISTSCELSLCGAKMIGVTNEDYSDPLSACELVNILHEKFHILWFMLYLLSGNPPIGGLEPQNLLDFLVSLWSWMVVNVSRAQCLPLSKFTMTRNQQELSRGLTNSPFEYCSACASVFWNSL
jgi:hypothetical protein